MTLSFSRFAADVKPEGAFDVLAVAKRLIAAGKDVIELEIGDSPFPSVSAASAAGIAAIEAGHTHYAPSAGIAEFRMAASDYVNREFGLVTTPENIIAGPGAKTFQTLFAEAFLDPGDGVLVFSPYFPTYPPSIHRRGARMVLASLKQANAFRPNPDDVEAFLRDDPAPKAVYLNSPHNPTGGVAERDDLRAIADLVRGRNVAVFSDEPYDQMVWRGTHHSILAEPGMLDQCVAAYTFSKSFSMSGWRLGFSVSAAPMARMLAKLTNTLLSCVPPFVQLAGAAGLRHALAERDSMMAEFREKVATLVHELNRVDGIECLQPGGSFYAFPCVADRCNELGITSHGLAMYLLEAADETTGVACLGGECFGEAGGGFLRMSCSEPTARIVAAIRFIDGAIRHDGRIAAYIAANPHYRLQQPYTV
ncbi:MAG: pyridoxal phosphate-dependent aminotransferase [Gammaproteobacteria bacterium]|jgi:aspartate aminotransferase